MDRQKFIELAGALSAIVDNIDYYYNEQADKKEIEKPIDIQKTNSITTLQCKHHEDKKYQNSSIAIPILEMLCHYNEGSVIGKMFYISCMHFC